MNREEFSVLYVENYKRVLGFVRRRGVPDTYCEDVAQAAWLKVYQSRNQLRDSKKFQAWLYRIARNQALDFLRSHGWNVVEQEPIDGWNNLLASVGVSVEDRILIEELGKQTDSERVLQIFQMRLLGCVEEEIATEMEIAPAYVRSLFHRFAVRARTLDSSISYRRQR